MSSHRSRIGSSLSTQNLQHHQQAAGILTSSTSSVTIASPSRRGFLSILFNRSHKEADMKSFISGEGSITQAAWQDMGKDSSLKVRLKALDQLQQVVRNRRLEVSTLEAVFHETSDLLNVEEAREPVKKLYIALTQYQIEQIGRALRDAFFKEICCMGLTEESLDWLSALTVGGEKIDGFEYNAVELVRNWLREVLDLEVDDHPLAIRVLQFAQQLVKKNTGFLRETALDEIVHTVCVRTCHRIDHLTFECLVLLDAILKFGHIPDAELLSLVTTLCSIVTVSKLGKTAWGLMRDLLRSSSGHTALELLIRTIAMGKKCPRPKVVVGAVSVVSMALWGCQRVETLRCQPGAVIPALTAGMEVGPQVMGEVFISMKRLLAKYGKDLQQLSWGCVLDLLNKAVKLCREVPEGEKRTELTQQMHQLIDIIEELHKEGEYAGSPEAMFMLIESCAADRPTESVLALIAYRAESIDPLADKWLQLMLELIERYLKPENPPAVREKAVSVLHNVFIKYHLLFEKDIIVDLIVPVLSKAVDESDTKIQYQMLNVLFDVTKTVTLRYRGQHDLFSMLFGIVKSFLSADFQKTALNDNLEIVAGGACEVLHERFAHLSLEHLQMILHMQCEHLRLHYKGAFTDEVGFEIRERLLSGLLSIICDASTGQLVKTGEAEVVNPHILRAGSDTEGEFYWSEICEVTTIALEKELWFPVLKVILHKLCRLLEFRNLVFTAGETRVRKLKDAIVRLYYKRNDLLSDSDWGMKNADEGGAVHKRSETDLAKYLCPVLSRLINYYRDENICKIMVECVPSGTAGCQQAIMACDLAVQIVPECMAPLARQLMVHLASLQPSAVLAIPIIEFATDSSAVEEFHQFFELKHFKCVIDVLAPYTNVHRFNTFIIAAVFRNLMRWYVRIPEDIQQKMADYIINKVEVHSLLKSASGSNIPHPLGEEDRQVNLSVSISSDAAASDTSLVSTTAQCSLSADHSEVGASGVNVREQMAKEAREALLAFIRYGRMSETCDPHSSSDHQPALVEQRAEHWVVNDSIISLSVHTEQEPTRGSTFPGSDSEQGTSTAQQAGDDFVGDRRRRHQSAVQRPGRMEQLPKPAALDDSYAVSRATPRTAPIPVVTWTQITVRHIFGKNTWLMRSLKEVPDDFSAVPCASSADAGALVLHLCTDQNSIKVSTTDKNKIMRSFRNIDRISALEMHTVGVVYVAHGQTNEMEILSNVYGSERYANFISMLGDAVTLDEAPGGLMPVTNGKFTYAYTDAVSRLVFHIATLMPKKGGDVHCNEKKKFIGNDHVLVIFNESGKPYKLGTISRKFAYVALEVVPQDESHVLVLVQAKKEISSWLAMRRAFLPDQQAAHLIRKLVLRAQLSVNVWRRDEEEKGPPYIGLAVERLRAIRAFAQSGAKQAA